MGWIRNQKEGVRRIEGSKKKKQSVDAVEKGRRRSGRRGWNVQPTTDPEEQELRTRSPNRWNAVDRPFAPRNASETDGNPRRSIAPSERPDSTGNAPWLQDTR